MPPTLNSSREASNFLAVHGITATRATFLSRCGLLLEK
jgi:hypothetical protein